MPPRQGSHQAFADALFRHLHGLFGRPVFGALGERGAKDLFGFKEAPLAPFGAYGQAQCGELPRRCGGPQIQREAGPL